VDEVVAELENLSATSIQQLEPLTCMAVSDVVEEIKQWWPVDTGWSRAHWKGECDGVTGRIFNEVDYVPFVHDGNSLDRALQEFSDRMAELATEIEDKLTESLNKTGA